MLHRICAQTALLLAGVLWTLGNTKLTFATNVAFCLLNANKVKGFDAYSLNRRKIRYNCLIIHIIPYFNFKIVLIALMTSLVDLAILFRSDRQYTRTLYF